MGRIGLAFKLFFKTIGDADFARRAQTLVDGGPAAPAAAAAAAAPRMGTTTVVSSAPAPAPAAPARSDAITLLAVLQREARLIDFLKEDVTAYQDAQIGAAVRDVHRDASAALERMLALRPVVQQAEGSDVSLPASPDAARYRLVGNLGAQPPSRGALRHAGWQATKVELPQYTGPADAARILAPAEVEV